MRKQTLLAVILIVQRENKKCRPLRRAQSGTYRVGNDKHVCVWCRLCDGLRKVADNGGVGVEKICCRMSIIHKIHTAMRSDSTYHHGSCQASLEHQRG